MPLAADLPELTGSNRRELKQSYMRAMREQIPCGLMQQVTISRDKMDLVWQFEEDAYQKVILSKCDERFYVMKIANGEEGEESLRQEVEKYRLLSDLQGIYIPRLEMFGHFDWSSDESSYFMAVEYSGGKAFPDIPAISNAQRNHLIFGLEELHERDVLHFDIRAPNIIFHSEEEMPFIIDFGCSITSNSITRKRCEMGEMMLLLDVDLVTTCFMFYTPEDLPQRRICLDSVDSENMSPCSDQSSDQSPPQINLEVGWPLLCSSL